MTALKRKRRSRPFRVAAVIMVAAGLVAGCSLLVDAGSYSGGAHADAADAPTLLDGAPGDAADARPPQGCARYSDASFCYDFDDASTTISPYVMATFIGDQTDGSVSVVQDGAVSAPNAARIALTSTTSPICGNLLLTKTLHGVFHSLKARVSVRAETEGIAFAVLAVPQNFQGRGYRVLLAILRTPTSATLEVQVQEYDSDGGMFSSRYLEGIALDDDPYLRTLDITVEMATLPTPSIVVRAWDKSLVVPTVPADLVINDPEVDIGPYCALAATTFTYDDLAVWVTP